MKKQNIIFLCSMSILFSLTVSATEYQLEECQANRTLGLQGPSKIEVKKQLQVSTDEKNQNLSAFIVLQEGQEVYREIFSSSERGFLDILYGNDIFYGEVSKARRDRILTHVDNQKSFCAIQVEKNINIPLQLQIIDKQESGMTGSEHATIWYFRSENTTIHGKVEVYCYKNVSFREEFTCGEAHQVLGDTLRFLQYKI